MKKNAKRAPKGTFIRLLKHLFKMHGAKLLLVLLFIIISTLTNVGATYTIQYVISSAQNMVDTGSNDFSQVVMYILLMILLYGTSVVFAYVYLRMMVTIGQDTLVDLRHQLFKKTMSLPLIYFDTNQHGDIMSRFTNDVDATRQMISQSLPALAVSIMTILGYLIAMVITSPLLSVVMLFLTAILFFVVRMISRSSKKYFHSQQQSLGKVNGYIEEMIEGQKVVKVFRHENKAINDFNVLNEKLYQDARSATLRAGALIPLTVNLGYLTFAVVAMFGSYLITQNMLTISALIGFLLFTRNFTSPMNQMSQQTNFVQMALSGAARIFSVLDLEAEEDLGTVTLVNATYKDNKLTESNAVTNQWAWKKQDGSLTLLAGDVHFKNVDFSYVAPKKILKDISLYAKPGQKIAFVGATGAGKTTITNLINRFYDIQEGTITYDGIAIKDIKKSSLRQSLGIVLQDTTLFTGTVMENIRYGNLKATDVSVIEASKLAKAHDFIEKLPQGYDTILTHNGESLSQGQRQLLSIARAALANPPVLILDEATSSIDTHTEKLIQEGMDRLMDGRTVFVIAHRLSTIKNAKAIIVLEEGKIIERGNHQDLLAQKGRYHQLYTGVFELE